MSIRGARILVAGACSPLGRRLVEAFLALGAHVIAADGLRTRLEELRAEMRQHERLWVAECDFSDLRTAQKLLGDVARDEPIDTALAVVRPAARERCETFVQVVVEAHARFGRGRALIAVAVDATQPDPPPELATWLVDEAAPGAARHGIALGAAVVRGEHADALKRMMVLCDPEQPAISGWVAVP